jgi:hypothetical protein
MLVRRGTTLRPKRRLSISTSPTFCAAAVSLSNTANQKTRIMQFDAADIRRAIAMLAGLAPIPDDNGRRY